MTTSTAARSAAARTAPTSLTRIVIMTAVLFATGDRSADAANSSTVPFQIAIEPSGEAQAAPHAKGNVYAPEVHLDNGLYRMWFGGQGRDGHDRIQLAESHDGVKWQSRGVVLEDPTANHVNDPSIVKQGDTYFMYYTRAASDVLDEIALATSVDGVSWRPRGVVLRPSPPGNWDSLLVGRPSVLRDNNSFRMWYDGRKDLPLNAPAQGAPKSAISARAVGYAESPDGIHWKRPNAQPVFTADAGGAHIIRTAHGYAIVYESTAGTQLATSRDGLAWKPMGLLTAITGGGDDRFGHVTPFLFFNQRDQSYSLFIGAARSASWDHNAIARIKLSPTQQKLVTE